jgi:hypothetical protein
VFRILCQNAATFDFIDENEADKNYNVSHELDSCEIAEESEAELLESKKEDVSSDNHSEMKSFNRIECNATKILEIMHVDVLQLGLLFNGKPICDTIFTNPPFGTKNNAGIDIQFLLTAIQVSNAMEKILKLY